MTITLLVEGQTEKAFLPHLRQFLDEKLIGNKPRLKTIVHNGRVPKEGKLRRVVENSLDDGADHVIALTDIYTGTRDFTDTADAKRKMTAWVGANSRFHPQVALHDFEAWLLPYWSSIQELEKHNKTAPAGAPESVNHDHPPSWHIKEIFRIGQRRDYVKPRDATRILKGKDLSVAAAVCPELKAFLNTILRLSGGNLF